MSTSVASHHSDYTGAKIGMWLFLFTEILLFGGLFLLYAVYRAKSPAEFHEATKHLHLALGLSNTLILLTSSLTAALSVSAIRRGQKYWALWGIGVTVVLALAFLVNKYFEWKEHIGNGMFPGSPALTSLSHGENLFFGLYYTMTGLHGVHVLAGAALLCVVYVFVNREKVNQHSYSLLENACLFWHLVDLIWIYLFPLFYLVT
ncbi:MAG: cytochrome c oxidase subunit 3 family protein [Deltaproteobacteria bacterium]|nr:cytochrome c oxidase subunit 3 family protein [Deltaproteobacteria bacterium]